MRKRPNRPIDRSKFLAEANAAFDVAALDTPERVLAYCKNVGLMDGNSTDIEAVIRANENLILEFLSIGEFDAYIEKISDEKYKIVINRDKPKVRQIFSMAHEYAHYQLHRPAIEKMPHGERILHRSEERNPIERQANRFAADILMPEDAFHQVVRAHGGNIAEVAKVFQVSQIAVRYRAKSLGIAGHGL